MPRIRVRGSRLYAGGVPWRAWGFNWGMGDHMPVIDYFDSPTRDAFELLESELRTARGLGANSMRIYLELGQVMASEARPRRRTLSALQRLLRAAERQQVYLDITGNLVWRPQRAPAWYERLDERSRWRVQAHFWRAVAGAAAGSPAVLCYELSSEPIVGEGPIRYLGELDGWTFVQCIAERRGRRARAVARAWTRQLATAVRRFDDRPVTIGLLPSLHDPAFAPSRVADLLDMLIVHEYPRHGRAQDSISVIRGFARCKKPVLLGETFMLFHDLPTQLEFLAGANPHVAGVFEFFDGRDPEAMAVPDERADIYRESLRQFTSLREQLLAPR
jgi:hypothetical protein